MTDFLSSYRPLCYRAAGATAARDHSHPPFVDHSCRREPDLGARYPSITNLCRPGRFAQYRHEGDRVLFLTVKRRLFPGPTAPQQRAVAALEVIKRCATHEEAADWYRADGLPLPSNCLVVGNEPLGLHHTAHPRKSLRAWEAGYRRRMRSNRVFLICRALFLELVSPPIITDADLVAIFGYVPTTQNPPKIAAAEFDALLALARSRVES